MYIEKYSAQVHVAKGARACTQNSQNSMECNRVKIDVHYPMYSDTIIPVIGIIMQYIPVLTCLSI